MDGHDALREIVTRSGLTHRQIESRLHRSSGYIGQALSRPKPGCDTLAEIARTCGYRLELVPMDGSDPITIGAYDTDEQTQPRATDQARALIMRAAALLEQVDE